MLSTRATDGDTAGFDGLTSSTTRVILLITGLAAGVMAAVAVPVSRVFLEGTPGGGVAEIEEMARAVTLFAPGLLGYALLFHLARVLYACGRGRSAAAASVVGWGSRSRPRSCSPTPPTVRRRWWDNWLWAARSA
ncbi:hypothetical protein ACFQX6_20860 [Streptosporangium lutulentum]